VEREQLQNISNLTDFHSWARLQKQHSSITVYHFPTKENRLLFSVSNRSKQTEDCHFLFRFAANKQKLPFSFTVVPFCLCVCVCLYSFCSKIYIYTVFISISYASVSNGKRKPRRFSLICFPFPHRANGSCLSFVHLLMKKPMEAIRLQMD
jgi:hypothetical protein